jgi:hypothetical protein
MTSRRALVPDSEIERVVRFAQELGLPIAGLDVGRDYVRTIPPIEKGESVGDYIGSARSGKAPRRRAG